MVDFGEFNEMIKISGKIDKSDTYNRFRRNISFFIQDLVWINYLIKNEILLLNLL